MIWTLMSERKVLDCYIKAWVTGTVEFAFRSAKNEITYCPNHPQFIMAIPGPGKSEKCAHCNYFMCGACGTWHDMNNPCEAGDIEGAKKCPACHVPVFKTGGCNRVTCRCGKSFCWKCEHKDRVAYNTPADCYAHLQKVHGGYWDT
jgi:hypothetical protein